MPSRRESPLENIAVKLASKGYLGLPDHFLFLPFQSIQSVAERGDRIIFSYRVAIGLML